MANRFLRNFVLVLVQTLKSYSTITRHHQAKWNRLVESCFSVTYIIHWLMVLLRNRSDFLLYLILFFFVLKEILLVYHQLVRCFEYVFTDLLWCCTELECKRRMKAFHLFAHRESWSIFRLVLLWCPLLVIVVTATSYRFYCAGGFTGLLNVRLWLFVSANWADARLM